MRDLANVVNSGEATVEDLLDTRRQGSGMAAVLDTRLMRHAAAMARYLVVCVLLAGLTAGCVIAQAGLLAHALSASMGRGSPAPSPPVVAALIALVTVRGVLAWAQGFAACRAAAAVKSRLRTRLLAHLVRLGPRVRPDEPVALMTRGLDGLDPYFSRYLPRLATAAVVPLPVVVALAAADHTAAGIVLATLPMVLLVGGLIAMHAAVRTRRHRSALQALAGHFTDVVAGIPTLKVFGRAGTRVREIVAVTEEYRRLSMDVLRLSFCSALVLEVAAALSAGLVVASVAVRLATGAMTLETGLYVLLLTPEVYLPLRRLLASFHAGRAGLAAADRAVTLLETPVPAPPARTPARSRRKGRGRLTGVRALEIRVDDVVIAHPGRAPLGPVSLTLTPGTATALIGPPGIGKSSLVAAMLGFVRPAAGRITLGYLEPATDEGWRRRIAWVPQTPALFAGTVADNIAIAAPGAPGEAVRSAAEASGVTSFTRLGAVLGPTGTGMSTAERQRIALARAVLRCAVLDTSLLLLDEPTAGLDVLAEIEASEVIQGLLPGRTALIVTDRQALLTRADRVVRFGTAPVAVPA
ncbi:MAG: transporter, CydDC cysteine exporter (CydDC-E) family, permease/ATP-binding protein CydD [Streptosporangiaceae bacterium]|nr:transporter, CydDC cysteine exporter (CydDC-E) family, permease/ATP-binding protein CydD [Streptosporangiaceae bacterium]